ncbi:dihydroorotase [Bacterioplanoides sp.]|uniref:dihydroorotase n=1 Tax=Bacterioplanoides sp. TaxID=2066072 RepID=UPI003B5BD139
MSAILIKHACIVNEGVIKEQDVRIINQRIDLIADDISASHNDEVIDASGLYLLPGMIDDQVHFREPGMPGKGTIYSESRAAVAGGITSYMEMPNVIPATTNQAALQQKLDIASQSSLANYSFYLGATNDNIEDIKKVDPTQVCGVKAFMGASTGSLLVDDPKALEEVFRYSPVLIATHCEDNATVQANSRKLELRLPQEQWQPIHHPQIRDEEACYRSSSLAVELAKKHNSDLHVLHLTTAKEMALFSAGPLINTQGQRKKITAEACVHHLWFSDKDYARLGNQIKCNPAIKSELDRQTLLQAINDDVIDIIATDHAPHTLAEKQQPFFQAPAGLPLVQHALLTLFDQHQRGVFTLEKVVEKVCHNPAIRYQVKDRGFIREGYFADLVLVDLNAPTAVNRHNLRYLCQWSPFEGHTFSARIRSTFVNGMPVYCDGELTEPFAAGNSPALPLVFQRGNS